MKNRYLVEWNTGDDQWDNIPDVESYDNLASVIMRLVEVPADFKEQLEICGFCFDDDGSYWCVRDTFFKKNS